jgi:hypothetical protein
MKLETLQHAQTLLAQIRALEGARPSAVRARATNTEFNLLCIERDLCHNETFDTICAEYEKVLNERSAVLRRELEAL